MAKLNKVEQIVAREKLMLTKFKEDYEFKQNI